MACNFISRKHSEIERKKMEKHKQKIQFKGYVLEKSQCLSEATPPPSPEFYLFNNVASSEEAVL